MHEVITGNEKIFRVREVAAMLRVSVMAVYRLIETGELSAVKVGGNYRITRSELERWLQANLTTAAVA